MRRKPALPTGQSGPVVKPGDLWLLGEHRLLCGDSTSASDVARVMSGERASLLFTSPPYPGKREQVAGSIADWAAMMRGVFSHLDVVMAEDGQVLVNLGLLHQNNEWHPYWETWVEWMRGQGWRRFGLYVWDQGPGLPGDWKGRLAPCFEFIFHFNRHARRPNKVVPCKWAGRVNTERQRGPRDPDGSPGDWSHAGRPIQETKCPDSVLRVQRHCGMKGPEIDHPAVFPVALPEVVMRAYSEAGDLVFEPFAGSGTTILAGERTGRRVRAIEIAPRYVDIALRRWLGLCPSVEPVRHDGLRYSELVGMLRQEECHGLE